MPRRVTANSSEIGPQGPAGADGGNAGKQFWMDPTDASDIATYFTALESPSPASESTIGPIAATGTGDFFVGTFASEPGVPGVSAYPAGTGERHFWAETAASNQIARFHVQVWKRDLGGSETLLRESNSPSFSGTGAQLISWTSTDATETAMDPTDRLVFYVYVQRVSGPATCNITIYFNGTAHTARFQTTISAGAVGPRGPIGPPGLVGDEGDQGPWGPPGAPGAAGATGPTGPTGATGPAGTPGTPGEDGDDGWPGAPGPTGSAGPTGSTGPTGPQGPVGPPGTDGEEGNQGIPGAQGPQGIPGAQGPIGVTGLTGAQGQDGSDGDDGWPGPPGAAGATGPAGNPGSAGPTGTPGPPGQDGEDGSDWPEGRAQHSVTSTEHRFPGGSTFLRADGVFAAPAGAPPSATTIEANLGSSIRWQGKFTITDGSITSTSKVFVWQAPGPYTGKGTRADEAEMAPVHVLSVEPATGSAVVKWRSVQSFMPTIADPRPLNQFIPVAASRDIVGYPQVVGANVRGKVRGNVKFSYLVF